MPVDVKIQCSCGTPYKFEVEPVNGAMPCAVQCPNCGVDGTAAANEYLRGYATYQQQAAAARPSPPPAVPAAPRVAAPAGPTSAPKKRGYGEPNLLLGTLGAVVGAFVGMIVWYLIIRFTQIEFGIIAWGVGGLTGFGCRLLGAGYSRKLGVIAGVCALVAIVGGEYLAARAVFNKFTEQVLAGAYDHRMEYAKSAVEQKTDQQIREFLAKEQTDGDKKVTPESITATDIEKFQKERPKLEDFIKGRPSKAAFEQEFRERLNSAETQAEVLKASVSLWTLLWLFLGVGTAFRLGVGEVE